MTLTKRVTIQNGDGRHRHNKEAAASPQKGGRQGL